MTSRGNWNGETGSLLKRIDIPDLKLGGVRDYLQELASSFRSIANRRWRNARAAHTRHGGRDVGVGLLIGYLIRRGTD